MMRSYSGQIYFDMAEKDFDVIAASLNFFD